MLATQLRWKRTNSPPPSMASPPITATLAAQVLTDFGEMMERCFPAITVSHIEGDALTLLQQFQVLLAVS